MYYVVCFILGILSMVLFQWSLSSKYSWRIIGLCGLIVIPFKSIIYYIGKALGKQNSSGSPRIWFSRIMYSIRYNRNWFKVG